MSIVCFVHRDLKSFFILITNRELNTCNEKRKSNPINKLKHSKRFVCEKKKKKKPPRK